MTPANHHPFRLIGGRLALDFLNTANWTSDGSVAQEKIEDTAKLRAWLRAVGLPDATIPDETEVLRDFRRRLRGVFLQAPRPGAPDLQSALRSLRITPETLQADLPRQPILGLIAASAVSILSDPREATRVKTCPGADCGWMFLDETKNGRRKWCMMETCGNRAKASRHYARRSAGAGECEPK